MNFTRRNIKVIIFDMDGVLVDTKQPLLKAWKRTFDEHSIPIQDEVIESLVLGVVQYEKIKKFINDQALFTGNAELLIEEAENYYRSTVQKCVKPVPGLFAFLDKINKKSVDMVVATSASRNTMNTILDTLKISSYFKYCLCSEDVTNRKPDPEVFQLAADLLKAESSKCLVFEDSPCGIRAANQINMLCVALTTTYPSSSLKEANFIIDSFDQFPWESFSF